jgi:PKD repeat protein
MSGTRYKCACALAALLTGAASAHAATIYVPAGGDLQAALVAAKPGDTILLAEGAEFVGNFVLPVKTGPGWITVRTSAPDSVLPPAGVRIGPEHARLLARLRSPNAWAALSTAPGAHHWQLRYLEFGPNDKGQGDIVAIGDGSSVQNSLDKVPHNFVLSHLYVHGDPLIGQKRGIALNAAHVTIRDSYVSDCKLVGQDSQALAGWNGPGPYVIENNYFEGAGENVMFGGADPSIPNLVADGITFRRNHLSRPMSWRSPILATPTGLAAGVLPGGTLAAGVYGYRVVARGTVAQDVMVRSTASIEVTATAASGGSAVRVRWQPVIGAAEYRVYGRQPGGAVMSWTVSVPEFVDTGAPGTTDAVPSTAGTAWTVKNVFELKSARNVVVEDNVLENHWKDAQPGYAIVLTPRNSNGTCTWCVVERVRFEYNLVRNVAAGINLLGYDAPTTPTRQTNNIVIRNNLFAGLRTSLGGNAWFLLIGEGPRDVVVDHNTIDGIGSAVVYTYGGTSSAPRQIYGFSMTANAARHGSYGFNGAYFTYGISMLNGFYPDGVLTGNYLAGGSASRYPAGNVFAGAFPDQFVDAAAGDFTLRPGSALRGSAPDGSDIGVDYAVLSERVRGVVEGTSVPATSWSTPPSAALSVSCGDLTCAFSDQSRPGSAPIARWSWTFGDGGVASGVSGSYTYAGQGTYIVTVTVVDANGLSSSASQTVSVAPPNLAPTAAFISSCVNLTCAFTDRSRDSDGTVVAWTWRFGTGGTATVATPSFTFAASGTYNVSLTVTDDDGATAAVTVPVKVVAERVHAMLDPGRTTRWSSVSSPSTFYWSAEVLVTVHGPGDGPVAGATVSATWSGALSRQVTCVTSTTGQCRFKSGTLSMHRSWVSLTVDAVSSTAGAYDPAGNHWTTGTGAPTSVTLTRP